MSKISRMSGVSDDGSMEPFHRTILSSCPKITVRSSRPRLPRYAPVRVMMIFESSVGRIMLPLFINLEYSADGFVNFNRVFIPGFIMAVIFSVIYFFICKYLMEKRLNLA